MQRVLDKHRSGIVIKQVAGGKEFKGVAFYAKPDVIHFKVNFLLNEHKSLVIDNAKKSLSLIMLLVTNFANTK